MKYSQNAKDEGRRDEVFLSLKRWEEIWIETFRSGFCLTTNIFVLVFFSDIKKKLSYMREKTVFNDAFGKMCIPVSIFVLLDCLFVKPIV